MKAYVQLGKIGDVLSILPILQHDYQLQTPLQSLPGTVSKVPLVIAKEFASILEGVSYVEPVIWKGDANDLAGAIMFAKKRFSQVVVLQTWGNVPIQHQTPSFQFDQWKRAGAVQFFDDWALTFDRRNHEREAQFMSQIGCDINKWKSYILFADHSQSSPFLHKEELYQILNEIGMSHQPFPIKVVRLSEIKTFRIFDLLALYDKALMLVTVETAHLHLSRASHVPTVALAAPGWRGSAFSKRFAFFMRYPEWDSRKQDLIAAVRAAVEGRSIAPKVEKLDTRPLHCYNLAHIDFNGTEHYCYRAHTNGNWKTKLFLNGNELRLPPKYKDYSHEDLRFFEFNGKLHGVYVMSTTVDNFFRCYVAYGEIRGNEIDHIQIQMPDNNLLGMTKNFVPFVHENRLHFVYGIKGQNQIVLGVDRDKVVAEYKAPAPAWSFGEIRGGCIVPHNGAYLRFFHSRAQYSDKTQRYFVGTSIIEAKPPFKTLAVSKRPILQGDECYTPNCHHWKANVIICYGCIKQGDKFLLSCGRNDAECIIVELSESDLNL